MNECPECGSKNVEIYDDGFASTCKCFDCGYTSYEDDCSE